MEIRNQTKRPLRVPLPGGKRLHLGPGGTGQVTPKALDHPPLQALLEAGDLQLQEAGRKKGRASSSSSSKSNPSQSGGGGGGVRHTGDR